jgi:tripartite-type tricarboxylate transporter receptor subunit TctC
VQGVAAPLPALIGFRQEPRIKLLAYSGTQRSKLMPELPTATEAGVSDFVVESWNGVLAPAGTPRAEVERLSAAIRKVLTDPAVRERMLRLGVETEPVSLDAFERLIRADWETAGAIVRASGARLE